MSPLSRVSKRRLRRSRSTSSAKSRRSLTLQTLESRQMLDGYGIRFAFAPVSNPSAEVSSLQAGESYVMKTFVQDQRPVESATIPSGIRQAVFDLTFDQSLLSFTGPIGLGSEFSAIPGRENTGVIEPGKIDNLNARDVTQPSQAEADDEYLAFEINVMAVAQGTANLVVSPANEPNLFAQFHRPLPQVTEFDVTGNVITIVGGGVSFTDADNVTVTEGSTSDSFQVALTTAPTEDVTLNFAATQANQVTLSTNSLTFTQENWNSLQSVQVTATDDSIDEDNASITIAFDDAVSADSVYSGLAVADVSVTIVDNDSAGLVINPTFGLIVNEDGTQRSSQFRLTSQPTSSVTINLSSSDLGEVTVSPPALTFTTANWNEDQSITLTGVADDVIDGLQSVTITAAITSADSKYQAIADQTLTAMNQDTDVAMLLVQPNAGLETSEDLETDVFNVRLNLQPASNVILDIASLDESEGTVSTTQLTFTPENWDQIQNVTVTGVDDDLTDGAVAYEVTVAPNVASDSAFRNVPVSTVMLTNLDNDVAGLVVTPPSSLTTTESGGNVSASVRLRTQPTGTVIVTAMTSDASEASIQPATLTFNESNWDSDQSVTITGLDDVISDGDVGYDVTFTSSSTSDTQYQGLTSQPISLTNQDDDAPGITLSGIDSLTTTEQGQTDQFTVVLQTQPVANVTITLASDDTGEVIVSPTSLTFTPSNWDTPQSVTVTGVNDNVVDGPQTAMISFDLTASADAGYRTLSINPVSVVNQGDTAGLLIQPNAGLLTGEDGQFDAFSVRLTKMPTTNVMLTVVSTDETEGVPSVSQLVFTPQNFSVPQQVTVTGVDDEEVDGFVDYQVTLTATNDSDPEYQALTPSTVMLSNIDDDVADLIVTTPTDLTTSESGDSVTIPVRLQTQPTGNVTVNAASSDLTEGEISSNALTFTPDNWDQTQNVIVAGLDDVISDGDVGYQVTLTSSSTSDTQYQGLTSQPISLTNQDDDAPGITLSGVDNLATNEQGQTDQFTVVLQTQPVANVSITLTSDDTGEVLVSPTPLTFTPSNWDTPQAVTVTGVNDNVVDGPQAAMISFDLSASSDAGYRTLSLNPVSVVNQGDSAGLLIQPNAGLLTGEDGQFDAFSVRLTKMPATNVTLAVASTDETEGVPSVSQLVFTPQNFSVPQQVTVTGVDDEESDGLVDYQVTLTATNDSDPEYQPLAPSTVMLSNIDNDVADLIVTTPTDVTTSESGASVAVPVRLQTQPTGNVTVNATSSDSTEGEISNNPLTFTPENWNQTQNVVVTGLDDLIVDGDVVFQVTFTTASTVDSDYGVGIAKTLDLSNEDDDVANVVVSPLTTLQVSETGSASTFNLRLATRPLQDVTIRSSSSDLTEGIVSPSSLVFTPENFDQPQNVIVTGVDDDLVDGRVSFTVDFLVESDDLVYDGFDVSPVNVQNQSDDEGGIQFIDANNLVVNESGASASFGIVLNQQPSADVTVPLAIDDDGEISITQTQLVFTTQNWDIPQDVLVTGVADGIVDADQVSSVRVGPTQSSDSQFNEVAIGDVQITTENVDTASLAVTVIDVNEGTGSGVPNEIVFSLTLDGEVDSGFSLAYQTVDPGSGFSAEAGTDYQTTNGTLNFDGTDDQAQEISVAIVADSIVEANEQFALMLGSLSINDTAIDSQAISFPGVPTIARILNDDSATLTLMSSTPSIFEGAAGEQESLQTSVVLSSAVQGGLSVSYSTADGTATVADGDYEMASDALTFVGSEGETQMVSIVVNGDDDAEPDEQLSLMLSQLQALDPAIRDSITVVGSPLTLTIRNDDAPQLILRQVDSSVTEGSAGSTQTLRFEVELTDNISDTDGFIVPISTADQSATVVSGDYVALDSSLSFTGTAGETQTFEVTVNGDDVVEADETFEVRLGDLIGLDQAAELIVTRPSVIASIANDDQASLQLVASQTSIDEGDDGDSTITLTVQLNGQIDEGFSINVATSDGTATSSDGDYTAIDQTLNFSGETGQLQTLTLVIRGDEKVETNEQFSVLLSELTGLSDSKAAAISLPTSSTSIEIIADDRASLTLSGDVTTSEGGLSGGGGQLSFSVVLSHALPGAFQLGYQTIDGTASAGADYVANSGTMDFAGTVGETQNIDVAVLGESLVERDETFQFELLSLIGLSDELRALVDIPNASTQGTITNDDTATISLSGPTQVGEPGASDGSTTLDYTVTLSAPIQGGVGVGYQTQDDTATQADYQAVSGSLVFDSDDVLSQVFSVTVLGDNLLESQESFLIELTGLIGIDSDLSSSINLQTESLRTNIVDDDSVTVRFGQLTSNATETGGAHFVDVVLETTGGATLSEPVVVDVSVQGQNTAGSDDFVLGNSQVVFPAGSSSGATQRVRIDITDDGIFEPSETVSLGLSLSGSPSGAISVEGTPHTVSITDDPMDGVLTGRVWADTDHDGVNEDHETGIAGVLIRLAGSSNQGESIDRETFTDSLGQYSFANLAAGTYSITQVQPDSYHNGTPNELTQITLAASSQQTDLDFGENGLKASAISMGTFTARPVYSQSAIGSAGQTNSDLNANDHFLRECAVEPTDQHS